MITIHTELPKVILKTEHLKVKINQDACWNERNLGSTAYLISQSAQRGYQSAMEYIGKVSQDGDTLSRIEDGGEPIIDIAVRDAFNEYDVNVDVIPKSRPIIYFEGGYVQIDFSLGKVDIRV